MGSILYDFDVKKYEYTLKEDGREEGHKIGLREGEMRGIVETSIDYGISREDTITKLMQRFEISKEMAQEVYDMYV